MIDENKLIELIKENKNDACCGDSIVFQTYAMAHDHIIEIVEMLAKLTRMEGRS